MQTMNSLLQQYLNRTEETRNEANVYLGNMTNHLEHLKNKTLPRTFQGEELEYLSEIEEEQSSGKEATIHIFEKEVREPVEALGFLKLSANYTANKCNCIRVDGADVCVKDRQHEPKDGSSDEADMMWADSSP